MRFVRKGRASRLQSKLDFDDEDRQSDEEEITSGPEDAELKEWLSTRPDAHKSLLLPGEQMVRKYLAPGTVNDLYEMYRATQKLLASPSVSQHRCIISVFSQFCKVI